MKFFYLFAGLFFTVIAVLVGFEFVPPKAFSFGVNTALLAGFYFREMFIQIKKESY